MRLIIHRHRVAALAAERVYYASHIEVLEPDHPERRFVAALCLYSHSVDTGEAGSSYDQGEAEAFARALLMPREALVSVIDWSDPELAELFTVPLDQVKLRRRDSALPAKRRRPKGARTPPLRLAHEARTGRTVSSVGCKDDPISIAGSDANHASEPGT